MQTLTLNGTRACAQCSCRIEPGELVWRELPGGTVRASCLTDSDLLDPAEPALWHPGCLPGNRHHDLTI